MTHKNGGIEKGLQQASEEHSMNRKTTLLVRINERGSQSTMWYAGQEGKEFIVTLSSGASLWDAEHYASGWMMFSVVETRNGIQLTDADILEQYPNLIKRTAK